MKNSNLGSDTGFKQQPDKADQKKPFGQHPADQTGQTGQKDRTTGGRISGK